MDIALQLYSIREEAAKSFSHALELTEKAGYTGVEFAGYFGNTPVQMKGLLAQYHLKAVSTHFNIERFRSAFDEELDYALQVGYKLIVCSRAAFKTKQEFIEAAQTLEACAQKAAGAGVTVGYHNHREEFEKFDGKYAMDILLETAPSVKLEPDVYWIALAGVDPVSYLVPYAKAGRICALHAKELSKDGRENVYIGQGKIDFASLAAVIPPASYPYIVEQEKFSGDHFEGISISCAGLKKILDKR
ncbi:sugar phosphate isomerase [Spirochaetia bacterium]|nr:sugar phosphate isomerase [Spirochaetia bacterium]